MGNTYFLMQENVSYSSFIGFPAEKIVILASDPGEFLTQVSHWSKLRMTCSDVCFCERRLRRNVKR